MLALGGSGWGAAVVWLPRALDYAIAGEHLAITSGFSVKPHRDVIALSDITDARAVDLAPGTRILGTSLPGYCSGRFRFPDLGSCTLVSNCGRRAVVLAVTGRPRPLVLTPAARSDFLSAIAGEGRYKESSTPEATGSAMLGLRLMTAAALLVTLLVPVLFFVTPNRLRYHVSPGQVEIHLTLTGKTFAVSNCLARRYSPETKARVIGTSLPGYHAGRFTLDGMATRVYATRLTDGVLIESPDLRLFLTPEDPNAFLESLRALGDLEIEAPVTASSERPTSCR